MQAIRVIKLNTLPLTRSKSKLLQMFKSEYLSCANEILSDLKFNIPITQRQLHNLTYEKLKNKTKLFSQLIQTCRREVWMRRKKIKNGFVKLSPKFENRGFKTFFTKKGTFCIRFTLFKGKSIVIPISKDRQFQRFESFLKEGWNFKTVQILESQIAITLIKEFPEAQIKQRIIGVDIGSVNLATLTVYDTSKKKVLKQLYFGKDIATKQRELIRRRARLQSISNKKYIRKLRHKQRNFVKTRSEQIAWEVVKMAKKFDAMIAVENIKYLRSKNKGRKVNGIINRIPYRIFLKSLESICIREEIKLIKVSSRNTTNTCICGCVDGKNRKNRLFKCMKCGRTLNSDRNASHQIALRAVEVANLTFPDQSPESRVRVNEPMSPDEVVVFSSVNHKHQPMESSSFKT